MREMKYTTWQFGDFELDSKAYELRRLGRPVKIERIPMDLLILLVERRGDLVSREDIVDRLWGKETFIDGENSINTAVRKVRQALRDSTAQPAFIQTVSGKGYRFCATVAEANPPAVDPEAVSRPPEVLPAKPAPEPPAGYRISKIAVVAATLLFVLVLYLSWILLPPSKASAGQITVALLPFENLTGTSDQDYFVDGLTEETIGVLGRVNPKRLRVIARTSTMAYRRPANSAVQVGQELGADYLLNGSVRREGERVRVTVHLVRVRDGSQIWSENYDRFGSGVIQIQDELGSAIARQMQIELAPAEATLPQQTQLLDAYDPYLLGRHFWNQLTPPAIRKSIEYFQAAIAKDRSYALAFSGLADAYSILPVTSNVPPREVWTLAKNASSEALRLNGSLAESHSSAGLVNFWLDWDWEAAEQHLRRAIQLNPNSAGAHRTYAQVLSNSGRPADAFSEISIARGLDPFSPITNAMAGQILFYAGRSGDATEALKKAFKIDSRFWVAHMFMAHIEEAAGRFNDALISLDKAFQSSGGNSQVVTLKAYVLARQGRRVEAERTINDLILTSQTRYMPPCGIALAYVALGNREAAFEWLEKAYEARDVHLVFLPIDQKWNPLRQDPKFQDILKRCHFAVKTNPKN